MKTRKHPFKRISTFFTAMLMSTSLLAASASTAFAADTANATIDFSNTASLEIYKYDFTNAAADGVWDESYISTGLYDEYVNTVLGNSIRTGDTDNSSVLGNGETSIGYAIKGVEFTYLKIADICTYSGTENGTQHVEVLYGFEWNTQSQELLSAIGLDADDRYALADKTADSITTYYFQSDVLTKALRESLASNATTVKNALENHIKSAGGAKMPETDHTGHTKVEGLELGLYLVVESKIPEMVTSTVNPFFVSLPMTSVDGTAGSDGTTPEGYGGSEWLYDVVLYPKNETGIPTLEKTVRESKTDTGKNNAVAEDITDGYAHYATASGGDVLEYQIVSTLPSITSAASYLTEYTFKDVLSQGLTYNSDVKLIFYKDDDCTQKITEWTLSDAVHKYLVSYETLDTNQTMMTISLTEEGLKEINTAASVYTDISMTHSGYSDCTVRIIYTAVLDSDNSVTYGDNGNPNEVMLLWKRTNSSYYDTLTDDAHVYTYGLDLTKQFSDDNGDYSMVEFLIHNDTDDYYVQATLNESEGIYYVIDNAAEADHTCNESDATHFIPVESNGAEGKVIVKGLEDDIYTITEVRTDNSYTLLRDDIKLEIFYAETTDSCTVYSSDLLGLVQNDPRYKDQLWDSQQNENFMQPILEHKLLTASAKINEDAVTMLSDGDSANAEAPLLVVNTHGYDIPATGGSSVIVLTICGALVFASASIIMFLFVFRKKRQEEEE